MATQKDISNWKPDWVALRILDFGRKVHEFGGDDAALAAWVRKMSEDLIYNNASDDFTQSLIYDATEKYCKKAKAGRAGGIAKARKGKSKRDAGNGNAPDASTTVPEETQAAATSNDQEAPQPAADNRGQKIKGDAPRREAGENLSRLGNKAAAGIANVSETSALDMPRTDKASDPRGYNTADVPPSYGPEDGTNAAQPDNPANDQSDRHKRGRKEPATDWDIRKDSLNMTDAGNGGALESGTSVAWDPLGAREKPSPQKGRITLAGGFSPAASLPPQVLQQLRKLNQKSKAAKSQSPPRNPEDVLDFARKRSLDLDDARLWYEMNFVDRPGCDKDGVVILNWRGHCTAYCKAEAERRKAG